MSRVRLHLFVAGRVQGVCFRDFTRQRADSLGVTGWVRNLSDGRLEAVLEGEEGAVQSLVDQIGEGPPYAQVSNVDSIPEAYRGEFEDFNIAY